MFTSLGRILSSGTKGFYRNFTISVSAILILLISLLSFVSIYLALELIKPSVAQLEQKVDVNLYFETDAPEEVILQLQNELQGVDQVASVEYVTKERALEDFRSRQNSDVILAALDSLGENPLGATFNIKATQISEYQAIATFLENAESSETYKDVIEDINYNQNKGAIDKLNIIIISVERFGIAISVLLAILAVVITYNTIRITIYTARHEIQVMRLVGASKFFARGPFIVEGVLYGLVAALLAIGLLLPALFYMAPALQEIFILNLYDFVLADIVRIAGVLILVGMLLGAVSSLLAIRKYLNI